MLVTKNSTDRPGVQQLSSDSVSFSSQSNCAQYAADRREEEKMCDHLISAAKHRDHVTANQLKQKILNILTNKHGAWGTMSQR